MKTLIVALFLLLLSVSLQAEELVGAVSFAEEPLTVTAVPGDGFLQLDSHFGGAGTFFTKGLAAARPFGKLSGSSDWRPFVLPLSFVADRHRPGRGVRQNAWQLVGSI